jgi:hypothetical protein
LNAPGRSLRTGQPVCSDICVMICPAVVRIS